MKRLTNLLILAPLLTALAACASTPRAGGANAPRAGNVPPPVSNPVVIPRTDPVRPSTPPGAFRAPRVMSIPGLESIIGQNVAGLERQFGKPRLNAVEGDVRKLQFTGEACVLDIYLYPLTRGAQPTATYVDARRSSDGFDVDRASCVAALKR